MLELLCRIELSSQVELNNFFALQSWTQLRIEWSRLSRMEKSKVSREQQVEQRRADFSSDEQSRIEQCWAEQGHLLHWYAKHHTASHLQHRLPPVQDLGTYRANSYLVNNLGPRLLVRGPSGLLTFSFAPFGRSDPRIDLKSPENSSHFDTSGSPVLPKIQWKIQK